MHRASGKNHECPGLDTYPKALGGGDVLLIRKLDRMGRSLHHLVNTVAGLAQGGVCLKVLTNQGVQIDTTATHGPLSFGIFPSLAEFEHGLIRERIMAGLSAARARGGRVAASSR